MNCERCPLEDTNDCKKCDPVEDALEKILEKEANRINGKEESD
jgi:hypothetical protein